MEAAVLGAPGAFFLVLVGAGGAVVAAKSGGAIARSAAVTGPGLMVMGIILFMGAVSGAHLNPAVSIAFATRGDFPGGRVPGYIIVQLIGATGACLFLWAVLGKVGGLGSTEPGPGIHAWQAMLIEFILTVGLVSAILGHSVVGTERGAARGDRGRRIHRPGRAVVEPDQRCVDESGALVWPRPGELGFHGLLGDIAGPLAGASTRSGSPGSCVARAATSVGCGAARP